MSSGRDRSHSMYGSRANAASTSMTPPRLRPVFTHSSSTVGVRRRPTEKLAMMRSTFRSISCSTMFHHWHSGKDVVNGKYAKRPTRKTVGFHIPPADLMDPDGSLRRSPVAIHIDDLDKLTAVHIALQVPEHSRSPLVNANVCLYYMRT
jgi:hypothetical protein